MKHAGNAVDAMLAGAVRDCRAFIQGRLAVGDSVPETTRKARPKWPMRAVRKAMNSSRKGLE